METQIKRTSIEQIAEMLKKSIWSKGDLKRIYIDRGYNTKKMSTKTYIYEKDGELKVSCFVDCPAQPYEWCLSQAKEVIENVENEIQEAIFNIENPNKSFTDYKEEEKEVIDEQLRAAEFKINKEKYIDAWKRDFQMAKKKYDEFISSQEYFEKLTPQDKIEIEKLKKEIELIEGTPNSRKRTGELKSQLNKYAAEPIELQVWMKRALEFESEDAYINFNTSQFCLTLSNS